MALKINFPLSPDTVELRRIVGDAENLHGKVDVVKTKTDKLPVDTAAVLGTPSVSLAADIAIVDGNVDAIKSKTDNLPVDTATTLSGITSDLGEIKTITDNIPEDLSEILGTPAGESIAADIKTANDAISGIATDVGNIEDTVDNIDSNVGIAVGLGGGTATVSGMIQSLAGAGYSSTDSLKDIKAAVLSVQNNTSFTASVVPIMEKPETGNNDYQILTNVYDGNGALIDPDFAEVFVKIVNPAGVSRNANLFEGAGQTTAATKIAVYTIATPTEAPEEGAVYTDSNSTSVTVLGTAGEDTLVVSYTNGTAPVIGTLTRVSGTGDATLTASVVDATWVSLKKDAVGQYSLFYNVTTSADKEHLTLRFGYFQLGGWRGYDRASAVQDYEATASVAGEVWEQATTSHTSAGSFGLLVNGVAGTGFVSATDSLHALKGRLDTIDITLVGIEADAETAVENIGTPVAVDGSDTTIAAMLRKLFDDGSGFDATTDSLNAIRAALDAKPTYPTSFAGVKVTNGLAQSGAETLEFSTPEGVITNNSTLLQLKVTVTGATTDTTVQIYEKSGSQNLIYEVQGVTDAGLNLALIPGIIFRNADNTVTNKIYVKVTNTADAGTSTYSVELRGLLNSN